MKNPSNALNILLYIRMINRFVRLHANQNGAEESSKCEGEGEAEVSDMEGSQISLPRSYTLPREFKYNHPNSVARERERRSGNNKLPASRFYLPSTNSSDGKYIFCLL